MMKIKSLTKMGLAVATFGAMAAISTGTYAGALVNSLLIPGENQLEDTNVDRICSAACTGSNSLTSGAFAVGDVIESLLSINRVNITDLPGPLPANYTLFAYSTLTITHIIEDDTSTVGATNGNNNGLCDAGEICIAITNPIVNVYEGTTVPSNWLAETPNTAISQVKAMTNILNLGIVDANDFWFFNFIGGSGAGQGITGIGSLTVANPDNGAYQFGVSATSNPGSIPFTANAELAADGNLHDFAGNGSAKVKLPGTNAGWLIGTDTTVGFNNLSVPEPGSLVLLGTALAGFGWIRRRQNQS